MRREQILILFFLLICFIRSCLSQEQEIEKLLENEAKYSDQSDLIDLLLELKQNPLNINTVSKQQLTILPWISPNLAQNIISYRKRHGSFKSLEELINVTDITPDLFTTIKEYLSIGNKRTEKIFTLKSRSRVVRKIEKCIGYENGHYFNSPNKYFNLLKSSFYRKFNLGLLFEKDSGERNLNDLSTYYVEFQDLTKREKIILGNYRLEFGQGLTFWNPYGYRKESDPIYPVKKRARGLLSYALVDENASLFGIASQICLKIYQLTVFISHNKLDASLNNIGTVNNFYTTGYHRSENELVKKDIVEENLLGGRFLIFPNQSFKIGCTFYQSEYDKQIENSDLIRNRYHFNGKTNYVLSTDIDYIYGNINLFGEFAQSKSKGWAAILGSYISFKPIIIALLVRNYTKNFQSFHGSGFGDKTGMPQNEKGFYTGIKYKLLPKTNISFYLDIFKSLWRTYFESMPTTGTDLLFKIEQKIEHNLFLSFRLKRKQQEKSRITNDRYQRKISIFSTEKKLNLRLQLEYWPFPKLKLRGRIEKCYRYFANKNKGLLLYQDVKFQMKKNFRIYFRLAFFDTDNSIYQFENDLPFVLTNQMLNGIGARWYICVLYRIFPTMRLSFKYAASNYENADSIGSGDDIIYGNSLHTISIQLESYF